jgi:ABC-type microcin C transport system permease subunit YejE
MKEKYENRKKLFNFIGFLVFWAIFYVLCPEIGTKTSLSNNHVEGFLTMVLAIVAGIYFTPVVASILDSFAIFFTSPIFKRRWRKFKTLRRGYYSFIIIISLFVLSFFAEFLINGNAIMVKYQGKMKFTLFSYERARDFGLKGYGSPNYRAMREIYRTRNQERNERIKANKGTEEDMKYMREWGDDWVLMPIYPYGPIESLLDELPCRPPHPPTWAAQSWRDAFYEEALFEIPTEKPSAEILKTTYQVPESWADLDEPMLYRRLALAGKLSLKEGVSAPKGTHLLGTDDRGRDVFARMVYGFRMSLAFALLTNFLSYCIGISFGALLGYYGGKFDIVMQRFVEIWSAMPFLYTVMIFASIMIPNFWMLVGILVMFNWMGMTYYIRAEFLREKSKDYVAAAKAIGCTDSTIIFKHILPNALTPVISFAPFAIIAGIGSLVSLDFLGFGLPAPTPSWGELLGQGLGNLTKPWLILSPTVAMFLTLLLVSFVGEAIREAFDPKQYSRLR